MIDDAFVEALRDCVTDRDAWQLQVEKLRLQLAGAADDRERMLLLGRLGEQLRQDRETVEESVRLLTEAAALAERLDHHQAICISLIRLATALQYANRHEEALELFHQALTVAHRYHLLRVKDFVLQHMGKCCIEMRQFAEARRLLHRTLRMRKRRRKPNAGHIESTQRALEILKQAERDYRHHLALDRTRLAGPVLPARGGLGHGHHPGGSSGTLRSVDGAAGARTPSRSVASQ